MGLKKSCAVAVGTLGLALGLVPAGVGPQSPAHAADERPNIVLITTDDQREDDLRYMPFTRRLIGGSGYRFDRAISPHPLCCPARATWMTGQYGHNNGVRHNTGPHGGYASLSDPGNHVGSWLQGGGYSTAMVGKFMNGYYAGEHGRPVGWDRWNPLVAKIYAFVGSTFFRDGDPVVHPEYVDDATFAYAEDYVRSFSAKDRPFFVWASNLAPHAGFRDGRWQGAIPAERHVGTLAGVRSPALKHPGYNVADGFSARPGTDGDPGHLRRRLPRRNSNTMHQARVESLLAVDEGVRSLVKTLRETGELANTYIVFTSDNGYLLGEHRLVGKNYFYEESLRVPLLVRVPGMSRSRRSAVPVTAVDLAPTIAAIAGVEPSRPVDGRSFLPLLRGQDMGWRRKQLVLAGDSSPAGWIARGVRTKRWAYARNEATGAEQLINRKRDPDEMRNLASRRGLRPVLRKMRRSFRALASCSGETCR